MRLVGVNWAMGWPAWKTLGGGADGGIKCAVKRGCLHCGFTSATPPHPLFKTIISCSIIHTIFTRANYTRPCHAEKMGFRVFYCCTHRLEMRGCSTRGRNLWLELPLFSGSVPTFSHKGHSRCLMHNFNFSVQTHSISIFTVPIGQYETALPRTEVGGSFWSSTELNLA